MLLWSSESLLLVNVFCHWVVLRKEAVLYVLGFTLATRHLNNVFRVFGERFVTSFRKVSKVPHLSGELVDARQIMLEGGKSARRVVIKIDRDLVFGDRWLII